MWISSCKRICHQKLLTMEDTCDFVIRPLDPIPPGGGWPFRAPQQKVSVTLEPVQVLSSYLVKNRTSDDIKILDNLSTHVM